MSVAVGPETPACSWVSEPCAAAARLTSCPSVLELACADGIAWVRVADGAAGEAAAEFVDEWAVEGDACICASPCKM